MDVSGILIIIFLLLCLSGAMVAFIFFFLNKRLEFKVTLKQKDAEKDLAIKKTAFDTQEAERKRIGEDLHDDIGPMLGALKMKLQMVGMTHPAAVPDIKVVSEELRATMKHVRKVSHDLVPQTLYEMGLSASLKHISGQLDRMVGLSSTARISDQLVDMDKKKELAIYRIVQESVNNAIKHSEANRIDIDLAIIDGVIKVRIKDDGIGISEDATNGLGLQSMKDRAAAFDGTIDIQSDAQNGTEVLLNLSI